MNKDLKQLDINGLKVEAYDVLATIENLNNYMKAIQDELKARFSANEAASVASPAETAAEENASNPEKIETEEKNNGVNEQPVGQAA